MKTLNGNITVKADHVRVAWPGVKNARRKQITFEGKEYFLLYRDSFPGMAKLIDEHFTLGDGDVLVLTAENQDLFVYNIYGHRTLFATTDANTGKVKVRREYLKGVRHAMFHVREVLEDISYGSSDPVGDFLDGNFGL